MTTYTPRPVDPAALKELRDTDDAGRPCTPFTATEPGAPLRCCLRRAETGERVALVAYAPLRRWAAATGAEPGAYDEQGPVFLHAEPCPGPVRDDRYPFARPGALRTVRRYDAGGRIVGGRLVELTDAPDAGLDAAFTDAFADPAVTLVHVRAAEHGCLLFEVRRH